MDRRPLPDIRDLHDARPDRSVQASRALAGILLALSMLAVLANGWVVWERRVDSGFPDVAHGVTALVLVAIAAATQWRVARADDRALLVMTAILVPVILWIIAAGFLFSAGSL